MAARMRIKRLWRAWARRIPYGSARSASADPSSGTTNAADLFQDFESVYAWHRHIEQNNIRLFSEERFQTGFAIGDTEYLRILPLQLETNLQRRAQARVIVNYQDFHVATSAG